MTMTSLLENQRIPIVWCRVVAGWRLKLQQVGVNIERDQTKTVCEDFILDNRGVVPNIDVFDRNCWNLLGESFLGVGRQNV